MQLPAELMVACLVQLHGTDGDFLGTGSFVAPRTVLTCAHVVSDADPGLQVVWRENRFPAQIRKQIPLTHGSGDLYDLPDLAIVHVIADLSHPCVWLGNSDPRRHSPLTGIGYRSMRGLPGPFLQGVGHDSVGLTVIGPSGSDGCLSVQGDGIVEGLSGSPVLDESNGRVCGLLKARRADGVAAGGWVIPIEAIARYLPDIVAANQAEHPPGSAWRDVVTDRSACTIRLFGQQTPSATPRPDAPPPSWWLNANNAMIPFQETPVFNDLLAWCTADHPDTPIVKILTAPGGAGKTRTGIELCRRLHQKGWIAGLVRLDHQIEVITQTLSAALVENHPTFIAVDYAEGLIDQVRNLIDKLPELGPNHIRILLLARSAQGWINILLRQSLAEYFIDRHPVALPDIGLTDPAAIVAEAAQVFRAALNSGITAELPSQLDAAARRHHRALDLYALALAAVLAEVADTGSEWMTSDPIAAVLDHERRYWERVAQAMAGVRFAAADELSDRVLAVPTLYPDVTPAKAPVVLGRVDGLQTRTGGRADLLVKALQVMYPSGGPSAWTAMQPDRLAEALVRDMLAAFTDAGAAANHLAAILADTTPAQAVSAVTILCRLAGLSGPVPDTSVSRIARSSLETMLDRHPHAFLPALTGTSTGAPDPEPIVQLLLHHITSAGLLTIRATQSQLAINYNVTESLTNLAIALNQRAIELIEDRLNAIAKAPRNKVLARVESVGLAVELAQTWLQLHDALHNAGRLAAAEEAGHRACALFRRLTERLRTDLRRDLATALHKLGQTMARIGQYADGVALMEEGIAILRALQHDEDPQTANDLAWALVNIAVRLPDVNRRADAVAAAREAVSIRTTLVTSEARYDVLLISSLRTLASQLGNAGQFSEALNISTQAYEQIVALNPPNSLRYPELLADITHDHSAWLAHMGRTKEAITAAREAIRLYHLLAERHPKRYQHLYAMAVLTLSGHQAGSKDPWSAQQTFIRGIQLLQESVTEDEIHGQTYAGALINGSKLYSDLEDFQGAIELARRAVQFCRRLVMQDQTANSKFLGAALMRLARALADHGIFDEAVENAREAVTLQERHLRRDVPSSLLNYGQALDVLRRCLVLQGHYDEEAGLSAQIASLYRGLHRTNPGSYTSDFVQALLTGSTHRQMRETCNRP